MALWFFFCNYPGNPEIYTYGHTLSLRDALPISPGRDHPASRPLRGHDLGRGAVDPDGREVRRPAGAGRRSVVQSPTGALARRSKALLISLQALGAVGTLGGNRDPRVPSGRPSDAGREGVPSCRRSAEHTSELQSLMRISYAVFCLHTKTNYHTCYTTQQSN